MNLQSTQTPQSVRHQLPDHSHQLCTVPLDSAWPSYRPWTCSSKQRLALGMLRYTTRSGILAEALSYDASTHAWVFVTMLLSHVVSIQSL